MYVVKNTSFVEIHFPDLRLILYPSQCIDLDKVCDREISENSSLLKDRISNGHIEIMNKDDYFISNNDRVNKKEENIKTNPSNVPIENKKIIDNMDLKSIKTESGRLNLNELRAIAEYAKMKSNKHKE